MYKKVVDKPISREYFFILNMYIKSRTNSMLDFLSWLGCSICFSRGYSCFLGGWVSGGFFIFLFW